MTDQQTEEFDEQDDEDVEAHRRRLNEEPDAVDEGEDDEVEAHRRRA